MPNFLTGRNSQIHVCLEMGATHMGFQKAKTLIAGIVEEAGGDPDLLPSSLKFQLHRASEIVGENYLVPYTDYEGEKQSPIFELLASRQMTPGQWEEISCMVRGAGMGFFATPGSPKDVGRLTLLESIGIKIAGADMNYLGLIQKAAETGLPVLLDARCNLGELSDAVDACFAAENRRVVIVHCPSGYPAPAEKISLGMIPILRDAFPHCQIGFSDHSAGNEMCMAAIALGATYIEKCLTLDRESVGPEHLMSLEPGEVPAFIKSVRDLEKALGGVEVVPNPQHRRSAFAGRDITVGELIEEGDVVWLRPGDKGISVSDEGKLYGGRALRPIFKGARIVWEDVG